MAINDTSERYHTGVTKSTMANQRLYYQYNGPTRTEDGLKSMNELNSFIQILDIPGDSILKYHQCLLNTIDRSILISMSQSIVVGQKIRQAIIDVKRSWKPDQIRQLTKLINHIPFDSNTINALGLNKSMKEYLSIASKQNETDITLYIESMLNKWEQQELDKPATSKRGISHLSSNEPSPKKQAIFTDSPSNTSNKKFIIRPANVDNNSLNNNPIPINYNIPNNNKVSDPAVESPVYKSCLRTKDSPISGKRVQFATVLTRTRLFTPEPDERGLFTGLNKQYPQRAWSIPPMIDFSPPYSSATPVKKAWTTEAATQTVRERSVLAAYYSNNTHIPPSPAEPDEPPFFNDDAPIIPNSSGDSYVETNNASIFHVAAPPPVLPRSTLSDVSEQTLEAMVKNNPA
ncbi:hypothetical protein BDB01DRAFT_802899 [Pilobolus umbonatus]|nr:hypothetical protein BDB01DRAFT_802899 [Pilobolus umbonatus]